MPLNFEMAATAEMVGIATHMRPHAACLVPEKREERTTEGGLDIIGAHAHLRPAIEELKGEGIRVSLFVEPEIEVMDAACDLGAPVVELHTGTYCEAVVDGDQAQDRPRTRAPAPGCRARRQNRSRDSCGARAGPRLGAARRRDSADRRAQYRPFPDRRGDLLRPRRGGPSHARRHGRGPGGRCRHDPRDRVRSLRHSAHRAVHRALRGPLHPPHLHRGRAGAKRPPRRPRPILCPALRRQGGLRQGSRAPA